VLGQKQRLVADMLGGIVIDINDMRLRERAAMAAQMGGPHPAAAKAMTALADDYTALVASQSGAAQLPSVATMQSDGAAFEKACP